MLCTPQEDQGLCWESVHSGDAKQWGQPLPQGQIHGGCRGMILFPVGAVITNAGAFNNMNLFFIGSFKKQIC